MAKKADLIAEAESLGIELDANETIADIEAKIALHKSLTEPVEEETEEEGEGPAMHDGEVKVQMRKVNRGSRRRIQRVLDQVEDALKTFSEEMDRQAFIGDEDGNRVADWPGLNMVKDFKAELRDQVNELLSPTK